MPCLTVKTQMKAPTLSAFCPQTSIKLRITDVVLTVGFNQT